MMQLSKALRVTAATRMAIVGSGGKPPVCFAWRVTYRGLCC